MLLRFFLLGPAHERLQRFGHFGRSHFLRFVIRAHHEARMDCRVHGDGRIEVPVELKLRVHWYCRTVVIAIRPGHVVILDAGGWIIEYYEGCEELLYERLEQKYDESVPGGPFKVWRKGPPFPEADADANEEDVVDLDAEEGGHDEM